jgi:hypothetical protein
MKRKKILSIVLGAVIILSIFSVTALGKDKKKNVSYIPSAEKLTNRDDLCEDIDIILIMDCSGSMAIIDPGNTKTRLELAQEAAKNFIDLLPTIGNTRVGVISYETWNNGNVEEHLTTDFVAAKAAIDALTAGGVTCMGEGFELAKQEFIDYPGPNKKVCLLLTDGIANSKDPGWVEPPSYIWPPCPWDPTNEIYEKYAMHRAHETMLLDPTEPTRIYTIGIGMATSINEDFLEVLAWTSAGEYFWGSADAYNEAFINVKYDLCGGDIVMLILANFQRMKDIGYDSNDVDDLEIALQDLADNNPNGRGAIIDLGTLGDTAIDTAYTNWDGDEGDEIKTNALVDAIDDYIEDLKQNDANYPLLRYVMIVGSHEVIPMKARPDDYTWGGAYSERNWASGLPQTSGYVYDLYHEGADGHYPTDTPYSDLNYIDTSADHELSPEITVARLVETPNQMMEVISWYNANNGEIQKNNFASIASDDYLDSGTLAEDYMVATLVPTDNSLIDCNFASTSVPPVLDSNHDVVYFAGHGNYNVISTGSGSFMAGNSAFQGDTSDITQVEGGVIITSGCHNGVNFGNRLYHEPDTGTTFHEFPEDFAELGIVSYIGATGYTAISGTGCNTAGYVGWNEKLSANVVYYTVNGFNIGQAFHHGTRNYFRSVEPITDNVHKRVLSIPTLYGIPTYQDSIIPSSLERPEAGYSIHRSHIENLNIPTSLKEQVTIEISDYTVEPSGIISIPGVDQIVCLDEPILPEMYVERIFPLGAKIKSINFNKNESYSITLNNTFPIGSITCQNHTILGKFYSDEFWPPNLASDHVFLTYGAGASEVGFSVRPIQYNSELELAKIWKKMVFDVEYYIPQTGHSVVNVEYNQKGNYIILNVEIKNNQYTEIVDLDLILRDDYTGYEICNLDLGLMGLEAAETTSGSYQIDVNDIPSILLTGEIEAELLVSDAHNGVVHASSGFVLDINFPPLKPIIKGPNSGIPKTNYEYTIVSIDPDGDEISYYVDWGDGTTSQWSDYVASGTEVTFEHYWSKIGTYEITAKAKDSNGLIGPEALFIFKCPRNKAIQNPFLNWLYSHPNLFPILRQLLNL